MGALEAGVGGLEVLVAVAVLEQLTQTQIADLAPRLRGADPRLLERRCDLGGGRPVDSAVAEAFVLLGGDVGERFDDPCEATTLGGGLVVVLAEPVDAVARFGGESAVEVGVREEDERGDEREPALASERLLASEQ